MNVRVLGLDAAPQLRKMSVSHEDPNPTHGTALEADDRAIVTA